MESGADDERDWVVTSHVMNDLNPIYRAQELVMPPAQKTWPVWPGDPWLLSPSSVEDGRSLGLPWA